MTGKEAKQAMIEKVQIVYQGKTYSHIHEYILWLDNTGAARLSVNLMDKTGKSLVRAPIELIALA